MYVRINENIIPALMLMDWKEIRDDSYIKELNFEEKKYLRTDKRSRYHITLYQNKELGYFDVEMHIDVEKENGSKKHTSLKTGKSRALLTGMLDKLKKIR